MTAMVDTPVKTITDQVCDRLRSELLAGGHSAGTALREEELATRFGVSRHPIRKVLQQLTLEGLLHAKPNCGAVVADSQLEHVEGLLTPMRVQLELYALRRVFPVLEAAHRMEWQSILRRMERACEEQDVQAILDQDVAFHQRLLVVSGLEEMIPVWQSIYGRMRDYHRHGNETLDDLRCIAYGHQKLIDSLFGGDLDRASADWKSHLENGEFNHKARQAWQRQQRRMKG